MDTGTIVGIAAMLVVSLLATVLALACGEVAKWADEHAEQASHNQSEANGAPHGRLAPLP